MWFVIINPLKRFMKDSVGIHDKSSDSDLIYNNDFAANIKGYTEFWGFNNCLDKI